MNPANIDSSGKTERVMAKILSRPRSLLVLGIGILLMREFTASGEILPLPRIGWKTAVEPSTGKSPCEQSAMSNAGALVAFFFFFFFLSLTAPHSPIESPIE